MNGVTKSESVPAALPVPSAEMILLRVMVQAHLSTVSKRRGEAFLRACADILATEDSIALVVPIRDAGAHADIAVARKHAIAMFRGYLPTLIASLPKD